MRFQLFGFPVRIHGSFWLLPLFLGLGSGGSTTQLILSLVVLVGILLVSLLAHELGHAFAARAYGESPEVMLYAMGGRTSWVARQQPSRTQQVLVTAAGPLAGYLLAMVAFVLMLVAGERGESGLVGGILRQLLVLNLLWSTFNLLPVVPFDGGQILAALLGPERRHISLTVSMAVAALCAAGFLYVSMPIGAVILGWAAYTNWSALRKPKRVEVPETTLHETLKLARHALDNERFPEAHAMARAVFEASPDSKLRAAAAEVGAWAALLGGEPAEAREVLARAPADQPTDPYLLGAVAEALGEDQAALEALAHARRTGDSRVAVAALYVKVLLKLGDAERAARVTGDIFEEIPTEDARQVAEAAQNAGAGLASAVLYERIFERSQRGDDGLQAVRGFAAAGQVDSALKALGAAVAAGLDPEQVRADDALSALSSDARFEQALGNPS